MALTLGTYWELVDDLYPGSGAFEQDRSGVTVVIDINSVDLEDTLTGLLGFSEKLGDSDAGNVTLSRTLPAAHPIFPWMYCTKITQYQPYKPTITPQGNPPVFPQAGAAPVANGGTPLPWYAGYDKIRLHVLFEPLTYEVLSDGYIYNGAGGGNEFYRYVTTSTQPRADALTVERGNYKYTGTSTAGGSAAGSAIAAPLSIKVAKIDIIYTWHQVPVNAWFDPGSGVIPLNQMNLLGTVNNANYPPGLPANQSFNTGTLLLADIKTRPHNFAVEPTFAATQSTRFYDIEFHVVAFSAPGSGGTMGHNSAPDPLGGWSAITPNLYPTADWSKLFKPN